MKTTITELLGIEYPVIQGGMAWVAEHRLAAAVSNAGGLGLIGAASAPPEVVREEIRKCKALTDKPFGVNAPESQCRGSSQDCSGGRGKGGHHRCR